MQPHSHTEAGVTNSEEPRKSHTSERSNNGQPLMHSEASATSRYPKSGNSPDFDTEQSGK